jgi:hypothetical protein
METSVRALFMMLKESLKNLSLLEDLLRQFEQEEREPFWPPTSTTSSPGTSAGPPPPGAGDEHFQNKYERIVSKDALTYLEITITSSSRTALLPKTAKGSRTSSRIGLRRCGWRRSGLPSPLTATLFTIFLWGVSELSQCKLWQ